MPNPPQKSSLPLKGSGFPDTVSSKPSPIGHLYRIHSKAHKAMVIVISRKTECTCEICKLNDDDWQGRSVSIRFVARVNHINVVLCPNGAAYELKQWVYSYPDETKALVNGLKAKKRLIVDGKTTYHTFKEGIKPGNHVKIILFTSNGSGSWKPLHLHPPPRESNNPNGVETAASVGGTVTTITMKALALAGII